MALASASALSNGEALADASAIGYCLIINYLNKKNLPILTGRFLKKILFFLTENIH